MFCQMQCSRRACTPPSEFGQVSSVQVRQKRMKNELQIIILWPCVFISWCTDKKESKFFSVTKSYSYMSNGLLICIIKLYMVNYLHISLYIRKPFLIWLCTPIPSEFPYIWRKFYFLLYQCVSWRRGMSVWECYCVCVKIEDKHDCCQIPAWVQTGAWIVGVPPGREDDGEAVTVRLAQRREPVRQTPAPMGLRYQNMRTLNSKKTAFLWATVEKINWIFWNCFVQHAFNLKYN